MLCLHRWRVIAVVRGGTQTATLLNCTRVRVVPLRTPRDSWLSRRSRCLLKPALFDGYNIDFTQERERSREGGILQSRTPASRKGGQKGGGGGREGGSLRGRGKRAAGAVMTIVYALIARGKAVLAEFTATAGNFPTVTRVLLNKIPAENTRMSYVWDAHVFHYIVENGVTYLCMADEQSRRRIPFAFLEDIKKRFGEQYGPSIQTAPAFSMNAEFAPVLQRQMNAFNSDPPGDSLQGVRSQIEDVRAGMLENVDKVLERGEKIELLVDKTDQLNQQAFRFDRASRSLRRTMYWRKVKTGVAAGAIGVAIMFAAGATACGGITFSHCRS